MEDELKHLNYLFKAASSVNLFDNNPVTYCVAVNDYRYYRNKFRTKWTRKHLFKLSKEPELWKSIKHPYDGKVKLGFKSRGNIKHWYNVPWNKLNYE